MHLLRNENVNHCVLAALLFVLIPARLISGQTSCADDNAFRFVTMNSGATVNCAWLNKNNSVKRISMYCGERSIMEACSASCDACGTCEDINDFMFELNFSGKSVGCDWFTKNNTARRTGQYCVESGSFFDAEIANGCVASCGLCKDDAPSSTAAPVTSAPASSPTSSCQDSTDKFILEVNNKEKGCRWAAGNPAERCNKDPTRQECPETCGSCGETTTTPTQGSTAVAAPVAAPTAVAVLVAAPTAISVLLAAPTAVAVPTAVTAPVALQWMLPVAAPITLKGKNSVMKQVKDEYHDHTHQCASWIPEPRRHVLFVRALGMSNFTTNTDREFMSGEYYAMASWDHTIRQNGFKVHEVSWEDLEVMSIEKLEIYHRIVLGCIYEDWATKCDVNDDPEQLKTLAKKLEPIKCKIGVFYWWDHEEDGTPGFFGINYFRPRQVMTPFNWQQNNTFLGMFPHAVLRQQVPPPAERDKIGLVLGKNGDYFDDKALAVIRALTNRNFTIHTTCRHDSCKTLCQIPGVINHRKLTPEMYSELLQKCAFMLGIGNPIISPSPIIALAVGVAFLNPKRNENYQHPPMAKIGPPYVYNIPDFNDTRDIIQKARMAVQNRFSSYIPPDYNIERISERTCKMLSNKDLCH
jgi:hypothetical protein